MAGAFYKRSLVFCNSLIKFLARFFWWVIGFKRVFADGVGNTKFSNNYNRLEIDCAFPYPSLDLICSINKKNRFVPRLHSLSVEERE